jgi:hypothetical protein
VVPEHAAPLPSHTPAAHFWGCVPLHWVAPLVHAPESLPEDEPESLAPPEDEPLPEPESPPLLEPELSADVAS